MADVFLSMTNSESEALQAALEFYGPMYLMYSLYDSSSDKEYVMNLLEKHLDSFSNRMKRQAK